MAERHALALLAHGLDAEARYNHLAIRIVGNVGPIGMHGRAVNGRDPHPFYFREVNPDAVPDLEMIGEVLTGDEQVRLKGCNSRDESIPNILSAERPNVEGYLRRGPAGVGQACTLEQVAALHESARDFVSDAPEAGGRNKIAEPQDFVGLLGFGICGFLQGSRLLLRGAPQLRQSSMGRSLSRPQ